MVILERSFETNPAMRTATAKACCKTSSTVLTNRDKVHQHDIHSLRAVGSLPSSRPMVTSALLSLWSTSFTFGYLAM
eukprot:9191051-Karenia_brevis.AAC.1